MDTILEVNNLKKYFLVSKNLFNKEETLCYAVNDISFKIIQGETLGLVGESGCGKTTTGRLILGLEDATDGRVLYKNRNILKDKRSRTKEIKKSLQIIFQDPYSSLSPKKTIGAIIEEPMIVHKMGDLYYRKNRVLELLETVGLLPEHTFRYPHELSGGQRQRVGIARALSLNPEFIVCDEVVSALDVSIQSQILNLLVDLQEKFGLTYLFIAHNLGVVRYISHRVAVMYLGKLVEISDTDSIFTKPIHPYTKALLSSVPEPDPRVEKSKKEIILEGDVPSPINPPKGCSFHTRCKYARDICKINTPRLLNYNKYSNGVHYCACHFSKEFI